MESCGNSLWLCCSRWWGCGWMARLATILNHVSMYKCSVLPSVVSSFTLETGNGDASWSIVLQ